MFFFFQAEDGIRDLVRSRGLGDVYKRQVWYTYVDLSDIDEIVESHLKNGQVVERLLTPAHLCLLYTSDAADDLLCVDLGGRRIITKKKRTHTRRIHH